MNARDVEHVGLAQDLVELCVLGVGHTALAQLVEDLAREAQHVRAHEAQLHVEQRQQAGEGVDRAAVLQISQHGDGEAVDPPGLLNDGEQVEQGLGGVLADAVAGVDDRLARVSRRLLSGPDLWVSEHDDACVALEAADRVRQALALGDGGVAHLVDRDDAAAESLHGRVEARSGPGGGLVEEVGEDLSFEQVEAADPRDHLTHLPRHAEDVLQVGAAKLRNF